MFIHSRTRDSSTPGINLLIVTSVLAKVNNLLVQIVLFATRRYITKRLQLVV